MIFSGDFLYPFEYMDYNIFVELGEHFISCSKLLNFESTLSVINKRRLPFCTGLYSSTASLDILNFLNVRCVALANNHVTDYDFNPNHFLKYFTDNQISTFGFGANISEASKFYINNEEQLLVLNYGWKTIKCVYATEKCRGVNPYKYDWVEKDFLKWKKIYPNYRKVLFLHWNYEFENLPLPADREFAHHMIDLGVDVIIGHHPHVINPLEIYKGKPIFYSLGNFYFPQVYYNDVKVSFRKNALKGISISYNGILEDICVYLHQQTADGRKIELLEKFTLMDWYESDYNEKIDAMTCTEYLDYYKKHHFHKNKLLPIYKDYNASFINDTFDKFVAFRQRCIDFIKK